MDDVLGLSSELANFVGQPENKRHFFSDFDIEVRNLGDLEKLKPIVEIRAQDEHSQLPSVSSLLPITSYSPNSPTYSSATLAATTTWPSFLQRVAAYQSIL